MKLERMWWLALLVPVVIAIWFALRPTPVDVDLATVARRDLTVMVEDQGSTRARNPYVVAAPVAGRLLRSTLEAGDRVSAGDVVARVALPPEDERTQAVLQANLVAAQAREAAARATLVDAQGTHARAMSEQQRREELFKSDLASAEERDYYAQVTDSAEARMLSAQASLQAAQADVESARSRLLGANRDSEGAVQDVTAPVDGTVYRIHERSERIVQAGTALVSISNDDSLEIVIDLLTQDAVQVTAGAPVLVSGWGGERYLQATVRLVEPEAFTKVSALGVEEQRVNVLADFVGDTGGLGAGYRVNAGIVVWEEADVLTLPTSALFQRDGSWCVFVVENDEAHLRNVTLGQRNREHAQVLDGIAEGTQVVEFPTDLVADGVMVRPRTSP